MSEHTTGKLVYQENADEYTHIARFDGARFLFQLSQEKSGVSRANARRLVAAWNLCDGVPTEQIEGAKPLAMVAEENTDMLAALRAYLAWEDMELKKDRNHWDCVSALQRAEDLARAVIAKVEGKS